MGRIGRIAKLLSHGRELRMALSGLSVRLSGDGRMGGLSVEETEGLVRWVRNFSDEAPKAESLFVEIGTLFGFTAKAVASTGIRTVAIDNFSWNPFGLTAAEHEAFTRRILEGSAVELVKCDASEYLREISGRAKCIFVFLDGDHRYEAVRDEIAMVRNAVEVVAGHDYGNSAFGVTRAVDEAFGFPDVTAGSCWMKRL